MDGEPPPPSSKKSSRSFKSAVRAATFGTTLAASRSSDKQADFRALVVGVTSPGTITGVSDAEALAARLNDDGMDTLCCLNPTLAELESAIRRFCDLTRPMNGLQAPGGTASPGSTKHVGLFYFSGFCLELDNKAYALPAGFVLPEKILTGSMGTRVLWQTLIQICMPLETIFERISAANFDVPIACLDSSRPLPPELTPHERYFETAQGAPGTLSQATLAAPALTGRAGAVVASAGAAGRVVGNRAVEWGDNTHGAFVAAMLTAFMDAKNVGQALEQMKGFVPILTCGVQECHLAFTGAARHALSKRAVFTQAATPPASPAGPAEAAIPESGQFVEPPPGAGAGLARGPSLGKLSGDAPQLSKERSLEQGGAWPPERGQPIGDSPLRERTRVSVSDTAGVPPSPNPRMLKKRPSLITIQSGAPASEDNEIARMRKNIALGKFRHGAKLAAMVGSLDHHQPSPAAEPTPTPEKSAGGKFRQGAKLAAMVGALEKQASASGGLSRQPSAGPPPAAASSGPLRGVAGAAAAASAAAAAAEEATAAHAAAYAAAATANASSRHNTNLASGSGERPGAPGPHHIGGLGRASGERAGGYATPGFTGSGEGMPVTPATQSQYYNPDQPMGYARGGSSDDDDAAAERPLPYARSEISTPGLGHDPGRMGPVVGAPLRRGSRLTGPRDALQIGFAAILRAMQNNQQDLEVQLQGCAALWNVTSGAAASQEIKQRAAAQAVPLLVEAMEAHRNSADLQAQACGAIWNIMCNASEEAKNKAGEAALKAVVQAMQAHLPVRDVQLQAAGALRSLTLTLPNKVAAAQLGAFGALVGALREHASHAPIAAQAAAALRNLTTINETRELAVESGVLEALVAALTAHALSSDVVQQAAAALATLAFKDRHRLAIADLGGLAAVMDALRQHDMHEDVVRQAMRCFAALSAAEGVDEAAAGAGGIALVSLVLVSHRSPETLRYGCRALANMAPFASQAPPSGGDGSDTGGGGGAQEGLLAVVDALACCPEDAALQAQGCSAIWSFVSAGPELRALAVTLNVVETLTATMRRHKEDPDVQTQCCGVVTALATDAEARKQVVAHGAVTLLVDAMRWNPNSPEVQKTGCAALWGLTSRADTKALADAAGASQVISAAMSRFPEDEDLQAQACGALGSIAASSDEAVVANAAAYGLAEVVTAMRTHAGSKEVLRLACRALRNMSQCERADAQASVPQALQVVLQTMRTETRSAELQLEGCKAIAGLTNTPKNREDAMTMGAAEQIADCMITNSETPDLQKYGCRALQNIMLASATSLAKSRVAVQLAVQAVCAALQTHENLGDVVMEALGTLWSITLDKQSVAVVAQEGAIDMVVEAMNLHASNPDVLRIGCGALRNIIVNLDYAQVELTDDNARGIIAAVVAAMQALPDDTRTQKHGFQTLSQLTRANAEEWEGDEYAGVEDSPGAAGAAAGGGGGGGGGGARQRDSVGSNGASAKQQQEAGEVQQVPQEELLDEVAGLSRTKFTF